MPTYEYLCRDCGNRFDAFQSIMAAPLTECPKCGGKVRRLIGGGNGLIFKGSGFYITDYKGNGKKHVSESKPKAEKADPQSTQEKPKAVEP